jgi:hypothetical protein
MSAERTEAELVDEVEQIVLALRERLDERARAVAGDVVATDELFVLIGQLEGALQMAAEHVLALRTTLEDAARCG